MIHATAYQYYIRESDFSKRKKARDRCPERRSYKEDSVEESRLIAGTISQQSFSDVSIIITLNFSSVM